MSVDMGEVGGEVEDELFDLNKEPVERKRKRVEKNNSNEKGNEGSNGIPASGRVLRSRTVAMSDGEKQVIKMEIVKMDDEVETEVLGMEYKDGIKAPDLQKRKKKKKRGRPRKILDKCEVPPLSNQKRRGPGRPPKMEGKCGVSSLVPSFGVQKKRGRGRPPKAGGKCDASSLNRKKDDEVMEQKKIDESCNGAGPPGGLIVKRKPGRPPKTESGSKGVAIKNKVVTKIRQPKKENESIDLANQKKIVTRNRAAKTEDELVDLVPEKKFVKRNSDLKETGNGGPVKRLKVGKNDSGNGVVQQEKETVECAEEDKMGLRERKQLLRDQIVAMLKKAGWSIEYRQRQSKEYQDAVYVDRDGRTYWSITLAYKKFKERIDAGNAEDKDVLAFSPIPDEMFSLLFRITEKGKKAGKKSGLVKTIKRMKKKGSAKSRSLDGNTKSRQTLLARRPKTKNGSDTDDYELYDGKRTLLSWMIDLGTVPLDAKVKYKRGRKHRTLLEGRITKEGICCDCCNITYRIRDFESHAGSTPGQSYRYIYLDSGNSLFQCLVDSWEKHMETDKIEFVSVDVEGDDPNDDTCNLCGDGGDLICCDSCPSTFHHSCLRIKVPSGDWHCVYCSCKFCGMACESISTTDDDEHDLSSELLTCCLCEEKLHLHCMNEKVDEQDESHSFCGKECLQILGQLQALLGVRHELGEEFSYTVLQHRVVSGDAALIDNYTNVESNSKLAVAFSVMNECFEPIIDERSGTNMIHNVVYSCGSNIRRLDYNGFYTVILEKGDEFVSAASIRIHGRQLAEMPFIGTRFMYRRQGMCSRLLIAVETVLGSLGVEKLVIPAISELNETWTKIFGFVPLEESKRHEMRYMSMIAFPGIDMLQKSVPGQKDSTASECPEVRPEHQSIKENPASDSSANSDPIINNVNDTSASESIEVLANSQDTRKKQPNVDIGGAALSNLDICPEVEVHGNINGANTKSCTDVPVVLLNEADDSYVGAVNVDQTSENGNCLETSKDASVSLKAKKSMDCNLEVQSGEVKNWFCSENGKGCKL